MSERSFYLGDALAHYRAGGDAAPVLLCPLVGWEDVSSYRPRRDWAVHLAERGHPVLRFDLPGEGDAAGTPWDPGRLDAWVAATDAAARWLAAETGRELVGVGIGVGGQLLLIACAGGAPVAEAVLWGVEARGRGVARGLRAFAQVETDTIVAAGAPEPPPSADASIAPGGFGISAETLDALAQLDVGASSGLQRVLLLERDGIPVDERLAERLRADGVELTTGPGPGYAELVAPPAHARPSAAVWAAVDEWLAAPRALEAVAPQPSTSPVLERDGVRERPLVSGGLAAVVAEPVAAAAPLTAVFVNAGALRRVGPSRLWVETARRWAARGVPSVRLDLPAIGDSEGGPEDFRDGTRLYAPEVGTALVAALDGLVAAGLPPRFLVVGVCSGGYWTLQAALTDERVRDALPLNTGYFHFDHSDRGVDAARTRRRVRRRLFHIATWRRLLRGELDISVGGVLSGLVRRGSDAATPLTESFDRLRDRDVRVHVVFCDGEPAHDELEALGPLERWPNVDLQLVPGRDHLFRPLWMREPLAAALDRALDRSLAHTD